MEVDEFIEHVGVKGMKWGVRRGKGTRSKKKTEFSDDAKAATDVLLKAKSKSVKALSNNEIRLFTTRLQLEGQFRNATPSNAKKVATFVKTLLGVGNTLNQVNSFSNSPTGQAVRSGIEKKRSKKGSSE